MPKSTNRPAQLRHTAIRRPEPGAVSGDALPAPAVTEPLHSDPMTATALEVLGLRALPSDPRELDALVAPRDPTQWTWEKTHAWRHLRALLNTAGVEARTPEKQARP